MTADAANEEIDRAKAVYVKALKNFTTNFDKANLSNNSNIILIGDMVTGHTALLNKLSECTAQLNQSCNFFKDQNLRNDFEATIKNFLETSFKYNVVLNKLAAKIQIPQIVPSLYAYNTIQTFINTFSSEKETIRLKSEFSNLNISIEGFQRKMEHPTNNQNQPSRKISIVVGAISILVVFTVLILKNNISDDFRIYLRILFALGLGGISAALIGSVSINLHSNGISAAGGFAVFVIVYFIQPVGFKPPDNYVSTINLINKYGNPIFSDSINLHVKYDIGTSNGEPLPTNKSYEFNPIAGQYLNRKVELQLSSSQWTFLNHSKVDSIILKSGNQNITLIRDTLSLQTTGIIRGTSGPLNKVDITVLEIPNLNCETWFNGMYKIVVPETYSQTIIKVQIYKQGYQTAKYDLKLGAFQTILLRRK